MSKVADVFRRPSVLIESPSGRSRPSDWGAGGRGGHPDPEIKGGGGGGSSKKKFFRPFGPHFGLKVRGGWTPWALPLDPPLTPDRVCVKCQGWGVWQDSKKCGSKTKVPSFSLAVGEWIFPGIVLMCCWIPFGCRGRKNTELTISVAKPTWASTTSAYVVSDKFK